MGLSIADGGFKTLADTLLTGGRLPFNMDHVGHGEL